MAGNIGSPLCAELNRIANNGVYPDRDDFLEEQGAANVWAGTTGQGLLGALNYIVDPSRTENNFSDLTKVCNELAGTTGLSDVDALRTINHPAEVLLRGTTPQSAVFSIDANNFNTPGYVYLSGTSGNFISVPDSPLLDVTGDIDIRVKAGLTSWATGAEQRLISKFAVGQGSYVFSVLGNGTLLFTWYSDGTVAFSATSTASVAFNAGQTGWVRVTLDVDNGASGNTATFYTSTDGITWTALGTPVVQAFIAVIHAGTANIGIGASSGGTAVLATGKFYQAQILNGINGTYALNANMTSISQSATSFTDSTNQTITINGARLTAQDVDNLGKAGSLLPVTVGSSLAADSNDAKFLDFTGTNYVYLPGVASNYLSVPDAAALDITGDIDLRAYVALDDWTPAATTCLVGKWQGGSDRSYTLRVATDGTLSLAWSVDGTAALTAFSTVATGLADGSAKWVRVTLDVDNGASAKEVKFYLSDNGTTWTQLGITVGTAGTTSIYNSTLNVSIGNEAGVNMLAGKVYRAQIYNGIDGTKVLDVDTSVITTGAATSFTAVTGQTVTINRSTSGRKTVAVTQPTWLFGTDDYMEVNNRYMAHSTSDENYVYLSGNASNYMSVADNPPLDVTGDLDIQVKVALDDWTPGVLSALLTKWNSSQYAYYFGISATNRLQLYWSADGTNIVNTSGVVSSVAPTVVDGATLWVRVTLDVDNGAGGNDTKFYTSTDGTTWTQLGTTTTLSGTTSIFSGSASVFIGVGQTGAQPSKGKFYRAIIKNGIDGTTVLDANAAVITLPSQTTFTDSSSNAYTVTINKSGVGTFVSTGNYLYLPGVAVNDASTLNIAATQITGDIDLRCKVALDDWTPTVESALVAKMNSGNLGYGFTVLPSTGRLRIYWSTTGSNLLYSDSTVSPTVVDGATLWTRVTLDVDNGASGNTATFYTSTDGLTWTQLGSPVVTAGVTSIFAATTSLRVGTAFAGNSYPSRGKFFRAQVYNGIAGTLVFDANLESSITSLTQTSFTEGSSNAATVTINRSGSAYRSAGVIDAGYLYPGATNTFANSTIDYLNFGATDSFTALVVSRQANYTATQFLMSKALGLTTAGYVIRNATGTPANLAGQIHDGARDVGLTGVGRTNLALVLSTLVRNTSTDIATMYTNSTVGTLSTDTTTGSLANAITLQVGRAGEGTTYADMELYAAAVFRRALTPKNITDIYNYFNGRD